MSEQTTVEDFKAKLVICHQQIDQALKDKVPRDEDDDEPKTDYPRPNYPVFKPPSQMTPEEYAAFFGPLYPSPMVKFQLSIPSATINPNDYDEIPALIDIDRGEEGPSEPVQSHNPLDVNDNSKPHCIWNSLNSVLIEGVDCVGKSTQIAILADWFRKKSINPQVIVFPDHDTETGKLLRRYLTNQVSIESHEAVTMLFSANRWEMQQKIWAMFNAPVPEGFHKNIILIDRYVPSGLAYGLTKGVRQNLMLECERGLWTPDLILYFDVPKDKQEEYTKRLTERQIQRQGPVDKFETPEFQAETLANFKKAWDLYNKTVDVKYYTIDAMQTLEQVRIQCVDALYNAAHELSWLKEFAKDGLRVFSKPVECEEEID